MKYQAKEQAIIGYEETLENLVYAVNNNVPTLLIGETGVGKTSLIRHLAGKENKNFRRLNLNGQTTIDEFVGKMLLNEKGTYWQDGILTEALREGHWLILDEINAALPEILFVLHSLLDDDRYIVLSENSGEVVRPHEDFRIFATMNPSGRYAGTKELNKALLSRFPMILQIDFPSHEEETGILKHYATKLSDADAEYLVKMANDMRQAYQKEEIDFVLSTRDLINCSIIAGDLGIEKAIHLTVMNRCEKEDRKAVETIIKLYFGAGVIRTSQAEKKKKQEAVYQELAQLADQALSAFSSIERYSRDGITTVGTQQQFISELPSGRVCDRLQDTANQHGRIHDTIGKLAREYQRDYKAKVARLTRLKTTVQEAQPLTEGAGPSYEDELDKLVDTKSF